MPPLRAPQARVYGPPAVRVRLFWTAVRGQIARGNPQEKRNRLATHSMVIRRTEGDLKERWIVGIDCAVDPRRVGVAAGVLRRNRLSLTDVKLCTLECLPAATVTAYAKGLDDILFALDSPLGWPESLGPELSRHEAGRYLEVSADRLFRRNTDRFIRAKIGKQSLDVGADRIARTAWGALNLLETISSELGEQVALAWNTSIKGAQAIEVYPAATLKAHGILASGYKRPEHVENRQTIINSILERMDIECDEKRLLNSADALDAAICVLGGADFLRGQSFPPEDPIIAKKEGWIWVRDPGLPPAYNPSIERTESAASRPARRSSQ